MKQLGLKPTAKEVREMIKQVDKNKNGKIEFDEFVEVMTSKLVSNATLVASLTLPRSCMAVFSS
jgi:Ca2+-binding EF-hand superfamily protein